LSYKPRKRNTPKDITMTERQVFYRKNKMVIYVIDKFKTFLEDYANSDPRFKSASICTVYLINLGLKHDEKDRAKALGGVDK